MFVRNRATITGVFVGSIVKDHNVLDETFYTCSIKSKRLSGVNDILPVTIPGRVLKTVQPGTLSAPVTIHGQVRSYTKIVDGVGRLFVRVYVDKIEESDGQINRNEVVLEGAISRMPTFRITPFGREISDVMLNVERGHGKSDYIPCIVWGDNGRMTSRYAEGTVINVAGRLQSRDYEKALENGEVVKRTVIELSVQHVVRISGERSVAV